jgi:CheY-like chemotaxis protein
MWSDMSKAPILIVDDNPENLLVVELTLKVFDIEYHQYLNATEAIEQCESIEFAFIVLDVHMPEVNGIEAAIRIRQIEKNKHTPILFLTADVYAEDLINQGYDSGAVDYLFKPINIKQLRAKAKTFIDLFNIRMKSIEAKKVIEEQTEFLVRSQKHQAIMRLSAGLSHNLNNRLTVVKGNIDLYLSELGYEQDWIVDTKSSLDECIKIVDALQGYAGYKGPGDNGLGDERVSLESVFENIQRLLGTSTTHNNNSLALYCDGGSGLIEVPVALMMDLIVPIVINALEAVTAEPTPILLSSSLTQQELLIEVTDLGVGMDAEAQTHIFEPFYSSRELYEGRGLGLSRVKGLIGLVDGRIEVKSNEPKGTTFLVRLPTDKLNQFTTSHHPDFQM